MDTDNAGVEPQIVLNSESFICTRCSVETNVGEGIELNDCSHRFCLECVSNHAVQAPGPAIFCLFPEANGAPQCQGTLKPHEIKEFVSPYVFKKRFNQSNFVFDCLYDNCTGYGTVGNGSMQFKCNVCSRTICVTCVAIHEGETCNEPETNQQTINDPSLVQLMALEEIREMVPNVDPFNCPICLSDCMPFEGFLLRNCLHSFCDPCLRNYVRHSEDVEIKCPFIGPDYRCSVVLQEREIKQLLPSDAFERYLNRSLLLAESVTANKFHCLTPDCIGWAVVGEDAKQYICPVCTKVYCIVCKINHEFETCEESIQQKQNNVQTDNKSAEEIQNRLTNGVARYCPTCKAVIERTQGCDQMQCSLCKTYFDWRTGIVLTHHH